jgi:hypothetical protein
VDQIWSNMIIDEINGSLVYQTVAA